MHKKTKKKKGRAERNVGDFIQIKFTGAQFEVSLTSGCAHRAHVF
jgi:hypothetical protein